MKIGDHLFNGRLRPSTINRLKIDEFYSDKSRIVFCSSFRRMMQKAQVFSLEANTSVRNRLTHSLEVAEIGRTLARRIGNELERSGFATLLDHFGTLLDIPQDDFLHFVDKRELRENSGFDTEWRIYSQLSKRMVRVYRFAVDHTTNQSEEWLHRARLIVDYVAGLTDNSALRVYQNFMGISLSS